MKLKIVEKKLTHKPSQKSKVMSNILKVDVQSSFDLSIYNKEIKNNFIWTKDILKPFHIKVTRSINVVNKSCHKMSTSAYEHI